MDGQTSRSLTNSLRQPLHTNDEVLKGVGSMGSFEIATPRDKAGSPAFGDTNIEPPNFGHYQLLLASLLLTTLLAVASAYDARSECISQEMYWLREFLDDDAQNDLNYQDQNYIDDAVKQEGRAECLEMFNFVIVPAGVTTFVFCILALIILRRHVMYLETIAEDYNPSHLSVLFKLFFPLFTVLAMWTYAIFSIMLKPKVNPSLYDQNPYKSLAAVDQMGHIGDNANLYYLAWICQAQIMMLVYHVFVECIRRYFRRRQEASQHIEQVRSFSEQITMHEQIQTMLSYTSARRLASLYKQKRKKWYQFMYHLRERSGIWVAAFFSSIILLASSAYVFVQVLVTLATSIYGSDSFRYRDVCAITGGSKEISDEFCVRSSFAVVTGAVASGLCLVALIMHILVRRRSASDESKQNSCTIMATQVLPGAMDPETYRLQLAIELLLSFCLSVLLGFNAVFATGAQGPAATVGNLYYASWLSFLLCLRICLGCVEELYHVRTPLLDDDESRSPQKTKELRRDISQGSISGSEISIDMNNYKRMAKKERQSRLRKYFFLAIFSMICFASAWDAAYNHEAVYSREQRYLIVAPAAVSVVSVLTFLLCLKPELYAIVSHICFGGLLSILSFVAWLADVIILMHSDDSWAVNSIGEMKLANLYYFSWAAILTAAMQMISYIKPLFGSQSKDATFLVWAGLVKVCMVILGASSHVWHNISDTCSLENLEAGERTFCSRTRGAMILALCSWVSGWIVMLSRIVGCLSQKTRARAEATLSIVLVVLFGVAVALITSIGGPGQSVGDLYYSTWLAFWVSVGIFVSCHDQIRQEEMEVPVESLKNEDENMHYVDFDHNVNVPTI